VKENRSHASCQRYSIEQQPNHQNRLAHKPDAVKSFLGGHGRNCTMKSARRNVRKRSVNERYFVPWKSATMPSHMLLRRFFLLIALISSAASARDKGSGWLEVRSPHFTVITDGGQSRGKQIAAQFERMRWVFQSSLPPSANPDPVNPIVVIAVKDRKGMEALEPAAYLAKGQVSLGGLFSRSTDRNYILVRTDGGEDHPFSIVYHEYTHLMEGNAAEWMPLWLNEGLAQFFENTQIGDREVLLGEPSVNDLVLLQQNRLIPLPVLFKVDAASPYYHEEQKGGLFYAESWALTHYLEVADFHDHANRIGRYIALTSRGTDAVTAARQAFGDLQQLQSALSDYTHAARYSYFRRSTAEVKLNQDAFAVTPLTIADADAVRADFLAVVGRTADARSMADAALTADPANAKAHDAMGRIEFAAGHHSEAEKWFAEAALADPQDYVAQYYAGALALMAGQSDKEAEKHLRAAIAANPRFAPAYDALASLLTDQPGKLDQAHMMELQAIALDPGNLHYRLNTAHILMQQEQFDAAVQVLSAAKALTREPLEVDVVQRMLSQVDQQRAQAEKIRKEESDAEQARAAATVQAIAPGVNGTPPLPKHPTETPHGPDRYMTGVIRDVRCAGPGILEMRVDGAKSSVQVYSNDAYRIDYRALNFTPKEAIHPCQDLEGMRARVHYFPTADKTIDGQITVIAMWK
jgi:tetratricopeptide (TPR) repeat protein